MYEAGGQTAPHRVRRAVLAALGALIACGGPSGDDAPPRGLAYGLNPAVYTVGTAIQPNMPSSSGGIATSWTVSPILPAGLALDAATGVVSGIPSAVTPSATFTVTAKNRAGSACAALEIAVEAALAPPAHLGYATNPAVYALGLSIPANVPSSQGGTPSSYGVSPSLPPGLELDPASGVVSGTPTTLAARSSFTVTATNADGSTTCPLSIAVMTPGSVWISPESAALTTRAELWFTAGIAGVGGATHWSASAGQIDENGRFTAPRLPGPVTVTAARVDEPGSSRSAAVEVIIRSTANVEITLAEPNGDEMAGDVLRVSARVVTRYLLEAVEADLDGTPIELAQAGDGAWSGEVDVRALPAGTYWLRVAAYDFTGAETELFRKLTRVASAPLR